MIATDEDALVCDLAETYHIFEYKRLPPSQVAVFACGLKEDSRIMMRMSEQKVSTDTLLLAQITDGINMLVWTKTEDAETGKNRPESITSKLIGPSVIENKNEVTFSSGDEFRLARERLMKGGDR